MTAIDRLPEILSALNIEAVDYVLFGGEAVNVHGILRFTDSSAKGVHWQLRPDLLP